MKFKNKIYKISSGTNVNLHATSLDSMELYLFNKFVSKKQIKLGNILRCLNTDITYNSTFAKRINNNFICLGYDDIISVQYEK